MQFHNALKEDIFNSFAVEDKFVNEEIVEEIKLDLDTASKSSNIDEPIISNKVEPSIKDIYNNVTIHDVAKEEDLYNKLKELNRNKAINSYNDNVNINSESLNNTTINENINNSEYYATNDFTSSQANLPTVEKSNNFNSSTASVEIKKEISTEKESK